MGLIAMPLYDYTCSECGTIAEFIVGRDEEPGPCAQCDGTMTRDEVQTGHGFRLLGGGWEADNYSSHLGDAVKNGGSIRS